MLVRTDYLLTITDNEHNVLTCHKQENPTLIYHKFYTEVCLEKLKGGEGIRQLWASPVYQKHRLLPNIGGTACPVTLFNGRGILTVRR